MRSRVSARALAAFAHLTQPSVVRASAVLTQRHSALIPVCSEMFRSSKRMRSRVGAASFVGPERIAGILLVIVLLF